MTQNIKSAEEHLYEAIGRLSIKFAHAEELLKELLSKFITQDKVDDMIGRLLIEEFSMAKTVEYLKKFPSPLSRVLDRKMEKILQSIDPIRQDRNYFIHGLWKEPKINETTGEIEIICERKKIKYTNTSARKQWQMNSHKLFKLDNIHTCIQKVEIIIADLGSLLQKIDEQNRF